MANVLGIFGANKSDESTSALIAAYGNDLHLFSSPNWVGQGIPVSSANGWEFAQIVDVVLAVNGADNNKRYNFTTWSDEVGVKHAPIAKYIHTNNSHARAYLGNIKYATYNFNTRVAYTDVPKNNDITYGLEYGTNLVQMAGSAVVFDQFAIFKTRNIKIGDVFLISSGTNAGQYFVQSVDTEQQITLTEKLVNATTGSSYWCGSNWVDIHTEVMGLGDNSDREIIFGRNKVFAYDRTSLRQIKGVPGTTSHRSIVNIKQWTFWFHSSGIYRLDGNTGVLISRPVQKYFDGILASNYGSICGEIVGPNKDKVRFHVGNITNTDENISINNAYLEFDTATENLTPGSTVNRVLCSTQYIESGAQNVYVGTDNSTIFQDDTGNAENGTAFPWLMDTGFVFPQVGNLKLMLEFTRILIHAKSGRGISVKYMLYGIPRGVDKQWKGLNDLEDQVTDIQVNRDGDNVGRGIAFLLSENSQNKPPGIERIDIYYRIKYDRNLNP